MLKYLLLFLSILPLRAEEADIASAKIVAYRTQIENASAIFNIKSEILAAVIYSERVLNYSWSDAALDVLMAKSGLNSSIGFCQIKIKTAYWIEVTLSDSAGPFFPGKAYNTILPVSHTPSQLLYKLEQDSLNILYAAAYLRLIQSYWSKAGYPIDDKPHIIATLYSIGLFGNDGLPRQPHDNPQANAFGRHAAAIIPHIQMILPIKEK